MSPYWKNKKVWKKGDEIQRKGRKRSADTRGDGRRKKCPVKRRIKRRCQQPSVSGTKSKKKKKGKGNYQPGKRETSLKKETAIRNEWGKI